MSLLPHQLELLAPARTAEIGMQAVLHGADAVYIGGPSFGARTSASNSIGDIAKLVAFAHRYHSRIFVTLNTILRDDELEPARRQIIDLYNAGVDALIIQDMGLLAMDLPPIQLHASTQTDIRTPEKARFLQDVGLTQLVLARELTLNQIAHIHQMLDPNKAAIEFFVHGALCVAYSGQCFISHAHTGRSANRGDCSQACRLPYTVQDAQGRIVAHDKHVLSMKDNNQSDNLAALVDAGVRSFKIEGRYKDMAYVKNITAHYRLLLDGLLEQRPELAHASSGTTRFGFTPEPAQNFNRDSTDYFVNGRQIDIGAFDSPKHAGIPIGWVRKVHADHFEAMVSQPLSNGDGFTYYDLQGNLIGVAANRVERIDTPAPLGATPSNAANDDEDVTTHQHWRIYPKDPISSLPDLRKDRPLSRNRDMDWVRQMEKNSSERRIGLWARLLDTDDGLALHLTDEDGIEAQSHITCAKTPSQKGQDMLTEALSAFGNTDFELHQLQLDITQAWFIPASQLKALRRQAVEALMQARLTNYQRPVPGVPTAPPAVYPEDTLTYLANVYNHKARDFYAKHGVKVIESAYEAQEEMGEVSLMITKHCVRFSLSLCPKQAKGVTGVQGTVKAEPMTLVNGKEKLTLRFDCKPCEMHVVGKMKPHVVKAVQQTHRALQQESGVPIQFYKTKPLPQPSSID